MSRKTVLITGACGLVGSEAVCYFSEKGYRVIGVDNNMRGHFFDQAGSIQKNKEELIRRFPSFQLLEFDIREQERVLHLFEQEEIDYVLHAAAQPSHDWAAREPLTDFSVNAIATQYLLEAVRTQQPEAVFAFLSTNKVYGDRPNDLPLIETETRYELPDDHPLYLGIQESFSIDQTKHSLFGVSKVAADIMVQEYGRYFGLKTAVFRAGCITGSRHAGVPLHGFLSYLTKCILSGEKYTIIGYQGKQVRDNIHAHDMVSAIDAFFEAPGVAGVYNMGGGRFSNTSVLEAIELIQEMTGREASVGYSDVPRQGDHIWYVSDVSKFQNDFPAWRYTYSLEDILEEMAKQTAVA
jgi:CDP-paratose 2-epimerase